MLTDLVLKHRVLLGSNSLHDVLSWHLTAIPQSLAAIMLSVNLCWTLLTEWNSLCLVIARNIVSCFLWSRLRVLWTAEKWRPSLVNQMECMLQSSSLRCTTVIFLPSVFFAARLSVSKYTLHTLRILTMPVDVHTQWPFIQNVRKRAINKSTPETSLSHHLIF